jgi:hypothetical protein
MATLVPDGPVPTTDELKEYSNKIEGIAVFTGSLVRRIHSRDRRTPLPLSMQHRYRSAVAELAALTDQLRHAAKALEGYADELLIEEQRGKEDDRG